MWHRRLGHLGQRDLKKLVKKLKIRVSEDDLNRDNVCELCQKAKQTVMALATYYISESSSGTLVLES